MARFRPVGFIAVREPFGRFRRFIFVELLSLVVSVPPRIFDIIEILLVPFVFRPLSETLILIPQSLIVTVYPRIGVIFLDAFLLVVPETALSAVQVLISFLILIRSISIGRFSVIVIEWSSPVVIVPRSVRRVIVIFVIFVIVLVNRLERLPSRWISITMDALMSRSFTPVIITSKP